MGNRPIYQKVIHRFGDDEVLEALGALEQLRYCRGRERTSRLKILRAAASNGPLKLLFELTFDLRLPFCVPVLDKDPGRAPSPKFRENFASFLTFVERLMAGEISGPGALIETRMFLDTCSSFEAQFYAAVLARNLKVGISQRLLRRVWPELAIDPVAPPALRTISGLRVFFVVARSPISGKLLVNTLTDGFRPLPLLNGIAAQFLAAGMEMVVDAEIFMDRLTAREIDYLLSIKVKTLQKASYKVLYYGLKVRVGAVNSIGVFSASKTPISNQPDVAEVLGMVRAKHPRTSIRAVECAHA